MTTSRRRNHPATLRLVGARMADEPAPLVRLPRVRAARRRIANGYYDREEVRDRLAAAVLKAILSE